MQKSNSFGLVDQSFRLNIKLFTFTTTAVFTTALRAEFTGTAVGGATGWETGTAGGATGWAIGTIAGVGWAEGAVFTGIEGWKVLTGWA